MTRTTNPISPICSENDLLPPYKKNKLSRDTFKTDDVPHRYHIDTDLFFLNTMATQQISNAASHWQSSDSEHPS